jgi:hypothetical protein
VTSAAVAKDYILIAGGKDRTYMDELDIVNVYDKHLTKHQSTHMSYRVRNASAVSFNGYAFFAGGICDGHIDNISGKYGGGYLNRVTTFDEYLTEVNHTSLPKQSGSNAGAAIGDFVLFAGGIGREYDSNGSYVGMERHNIVCAYTIQE